MSNPCKGIPSPNLIEDETPTSILTGRRLEILKAVEGYQNAYRKHTDPRNRETADKVTGTYRHMMAVIISGVK